MREARRVPGWAWLTALAGCALALLCGCVAVAGGGWWLVRQPGSGLLRAAPTPIPPVNRIAYVGNDGNIYTVAPDGSDAQALTSDGEAGTRIQRTYRWPTWSPDSRHLAYVGLALVGGATEGRLLATPTDGGPTETLHTASEDPPFYLYWAPDSRRVGFLARADEGLTLQVAALGESEAREVARGSPLYWAWTSDSQRLIYHSGGSRRDSSEARVGLADRAGAEPVALSDRPGAFLAPDCCADGRAMLYARDVGNVDELVVADLDTQDAGRALLSYNGAISFAWSPRGGQVAYIISPEPSPSGLGQIALGPLGVIDADGANQRTLADERVLAFFWSPDGGSLAYVTLSREPQDDALRVRLAVVDVSSGEQRTVATFAPTEEFVTLIPFFDQYQRSVRLWSPDSRSLVFTATDEQAGAGVYVVDVAPPSEPRRIADGIQAVWSWR